MAVGGSNLTVEHSFWTKENEKELYNNGVVTVSCKSSDGVKHKFKVTGNPLDGKGIRVVEIFGIWVTAKAVPTEVCSVALQQILVKSDTQELSWLKNQTLAAQNEQFWTIVTDASAKQAAMIMREFLYFRDQLEPSTQQETCEEFPTQQDTIEDDSFTFEGMVKLDVFNQPEDVEQIEDTTKSARDDVDQTEVTANPEHEDVVQAEVTTKQDDAEIDQVDVVMAPEADFIFSDSKMVSLALNDPQKLVFLVRTLPTHKQQPYFERISPLISSADFITSFINLKAECQLNHLLDILGPAGITRIINDGTITTLLQHKHLKAESIVSLLIKMPHDSSSEVVRACFKVMVLRQASTEVIKSACKRLPPLVWEMLKKDSKLDSYLLQLIESDILKACVLISVLNEHIPGVVSITVVIHMLKQNDALICEPELSREERIRKTWAEYILPPVQKAINSRREQAKDEWKQCLSYLLINESRTQGTYCLRWMPRATHLCIGLSDNASELERVRHFGVKIPSILKTLSEVTPQLSAKHPSEIEELVKLVVDDIADRDTRRMSNLTLSILLEYSSGQVKQQIINTLYKYVLSHPTMYDYIKANVLDFAALRGVITFNVELQADIEQVKSDDFRLLLAIYSCLQLEQKPSAGFLIAQRLLVFSDRDFDKAIPEDEQRAKRYDEDNSVFTDALYDMEGSLAGLLASPESKQKRFSLAVKRVFTESRKPSPTRIVSALQLALNNSAPEQHQRLIKNAVELIEHVQSLQTDGKDLMLECFILMPTDAKAILISTNKSITNVISSRKLQLLRSIPVDEAISVFKQSETSESAKRILGLFTQRLASEFQDDAAGNSERLANIKAQATAIITMLPDMLTGWDLNYLAQILGDDFAKACVQVPWTTIEQLYPYQPSKAKELLIKHVNNEFLFEYFSSEEPLYKAELAKALSLEQKQEYLAYLKENKSEFKALQMVMALETQVRAQFIMDSFGEDADDLQQTIIARATRTTGAKQLNLQQLTNLASMLNQHYRANLLSQLPADTAAKISEELGKYESQV
ncbi:hypothetical protein [Parashewanella tropica]|uniref:hypothetical protein n=1 Tax=Parashewanella tropica TaxID=2547970 RepID=UPI001059BA50|nr:hypothetical protein [Parashewanella tropica]